MATFCLTKDASKRFKQALKDREIDPFKMASMDSLARRNLLAKYVGETNAVHVNALFESKLLLKNQKAGYQSWAKNIGGISSPAKRDIISRIERLDKVLNPSEEKAFLQDLATTRLGLEITPEEARTVSDISTKLTELRSKFDIKTEKWSDQKTADLYGAVQVQLEKYLQELKDGKSSMGQILKNRGSQFTTEFKDNKARAIGKVILDSAKTLVDTSTSVVASWDDSLFGRQAIPVLLSGHPVIWSKNFLKSFVDMRNTIYGQKTTEALLAKLYSDPLYLNGEYKKAGIVDINEEQFPTSLPEKIPVLGRVFETAEATFKNGAIRIRTELYQMMRNTKIEKGIDLTDEEIKGMGRIVNSLMARGHLGRAGENSVVRLLMWAPKMLKADLDLITAHTFQDIPKSDRVTARWNLVKIIVATAIINSVAASVKKDSVEFDPRSSDFLKIDGKYGYLRGMPQIITLMARLISGQYKNAKGEIINYEPGIGKRSRLDAIIAFLRGKAPPATGGTYDVLAGQDYQGNPPTFTSILLQRGVPISAQNLIQLRKNPSIDNTFGIIADFFGFNSNINPEPNIKSQIIPEGKKVKSTDIIELTKTYAEAINSDPETAFNRIFTGQKIVKVAGGAIIVERMSLYDSQAIKKKYGKDTKQVKLDHTVPLELGGSNDTSNLKLVSTAEWSSYTKVENTLGRALKAKKITKDQAQSEIRKFKSYTDNAKRKEYGAYLMSKYR